MYSPLPYLLLWWSIARTQPPMVYDHRPPMVALQRNIPLNPPVSTFVRWYCGGNTALLRVR